VEYKANYKEALCRLNELYSKRGLNKIYAKMNIQNPYLDEYKISNPDCETTYPDIDERINFWDKVLSFNKDIQDDSIPSCYLSEFDQGLYSALLGAKIRFLNSASTGWVSSMCAPFVSDINNIDNFILDENNIWYKRYLQQLELFKKKAYSKFGISHFILISGMNFIIEMLGATDAYYLMLEDEENTQKAIDFSIKLNIWVHNTFFEHIGLFEGGTCSNFAGWIPGKIVSESVDPFHLTDIETFKRWGKKTIEEIFSKYDGGTVHIHGNGHHLIEEVSNIEGIKCIHFIDEEFNTPAYKKLYEISEKRSNVPIIISIPYIDFYIMLNEKTLENNILYDVQNVPNIKIANSLMHEVKQYNV
jgi:hypothetical protein